MADAERIPCNGLFYAMARNALHGLFLPACISMYACMLAVTNPDTVKRICSTLRRAALRPARDVANTCLRLVFVPLACACSYRGMRMTAVHTKYKFFCIKKKPPYGGLVYSLNARVSSGHMRVAMR